MAVTATRSDASPDDRLADAGSGRSGPPRPGRTTVFLVAVLALAALAAAGTVGWLARGGGATAATASSVDAGFARDMSTHHTQAVIMAGFVRDHSADEAIRTLGFDIESAQNGQVGEMTGWLDSWGLSRTSSEPLMAWMGGHDHGSGHDAMGTAPTAAGSTAADPGSVSLMPGMATPDEVTRLQGLRGKALDVFFLQLMLRHHIGGVEMAQYAAEHAKHDYVRGLARSMVANQQAEIATMRAMLTARGAAPL